MNGILKPQKVFGKDVTERDFTEFYYTYASSTFPPDYQRYYFYAEGGKIWFYHEKREGTRFPLQEEDITVSGKKALSGQEKAVFFSYLNGGTVKNREEHLEDGDAGPWLYLYWNGDGGKCQEFSFVSVEKRLAFEAYCEELRKSAAQGEGGALDKKLAARMKKEVRSMM